MADFFTKFKRLFIGELTVEDREFRRFDEDNSVLTRTDEVKHILIDNADPQAVFTGRTLDQTALETDPVWQIKREAIIGQNTQILFANQGQYDQIWDNRRNLFPVIPFNNAFSLNFDGTDEYLNIPDNSNISFEFNDSFSFSLWIRPDGFGADKALISKVETNGSRQGYILTTTQQRRLKLSLIEDDQTNSKIEVRTVGTLNDGVWTHVVATYSGNNAASGISMYFDGVLQTNDVLTDVPILTTIENAKALRMAAENDSSKFYDGRIDEVSIWSQELTSAQVSQIYNSGEPNDVRQLPFGPPISFWRMGDNDVFPKIFDVQDNNAAVAVNMETSDVNGLIP